jgi:hypothetical protein
MYVKKANTIRRISDRIWKIEKAKAYIQRMGYQAFDPAKAKKEDLQAIADNKKNHILPQLLAIMKEKGVKVEKPGVKTAPKAGKK